ncbi:MAG TPA: methylenetetrahydrofolate reductase, partial [Rhodothermales bacterium]
MDRDLSVPVECGLVRRLLDGDFAVTAEITPPVSGSADALLAKVEPLRGRVDAINLTDGASARVHMSSLAAAAILVTHGMEPILQMTCRDRNRIALMGDLLGASALGVKSVLILTGDDPASGDQPDAKPVFDLKSEELLRIASQMSTEGKIPSTGLRRLDGGVAPSTRPIDAPPRFFLGAADTPTGERDDRWIAALRRKI